jgi:DNA polymerase-1
VALEEAKNYSCEDVAAVIVLWEDFKVQLQKNNLTELFEKVETPLIPVLVRMENAGIKINQTLLSELSEEFGGKLDELTREIFELAGREFNINSPKQLAEILFEELRLPHGRKTKTGYSTDLQVLEKLAAIHKLPKRIIDHRNLSKLKSTYVDKLGALVNPKTNRIHTSFNQTITATGRLSSSNPNLQNIPVRTAEGQRIREAFIPEKDHIFVSADYSQIDLRVLAHYSEDKVLVDSFRAGDDIHRKTAAEIFRVHPSLVTKQMRRVAKSINFGIVYGMSPFGLASQLNISRHDAVVFIERYLDIYKGVRKFMDDIVAQAKRDGFVTTLMGRKRNLPDINSPNKTRREFAERTALNTPIQGTAADIIKLASIDVEKHLQEKKLGARLLLQIHDELIFETPQHESEQTCQVVKVSMEKCFRLQVPLVVNLATGFNLAKV